MPFLSNHASTSARPISRKKKDKGLGLHRVLSNEANMANMPYAVPSGGVALGRQVQTMPPSAMFDPPTPPLAPQNPLPPNVISPTTPKRPRPIRYSTSESEGGESSEDEPPPFWLFTSMGMAKMRERTMRRKREKEDTEDSPAESEEKPRRKFIPSRKSSKNDDDKIKPTSSNKSIPLAPPLPIPIRSRSTFNPDLKWRRSIPDEVQSDSEITRRRVFTRSNSAPGSAALDAHPLSSIITANPAVSEPVSIAPPSRSKRQPTFARLRKLRTDQSGHVSDSELPPPAHRRSFPSQPESAPRMRRLNTAKISQHFGHGWPHAGTWQDALYGTYDEGQTEGEPGLRPVKKRKSAERDRETSGDTLVPEPVPRRKTKPRRYRQALAPPTPKGLGFSPHDEQGSRWKEGKVNQTEFNWTSPTTNTTQHIPQPTGSTILEGDELSRFNTRTADEKRNKLDEKKVKPKRTGRTKREGEDWKIRLKRMMFLDARLTIFLRLMDIIVVATLLGLTISIRQSLIQLQLPGLIGPSTTLIISFAAFTLFHAVTAIYREYFGKPIGLWGLRSKMLWVCLDLLFVGLWSSALSTGINDYISTPLMCTRDDPWWIMGLRSSYTDLLAENATGSATSADLIKATLGIVLPEQILQTPLVREICGRQIGCIALSLFVLLLYAGNMVLSLFRIFETVRRSANVGRALMV